MSRCIAYPSEIVFQLVHGIDLQDCKEPKYHESNDESNEESNEESNNESNEESNLEEGEVNYEELKYQLMSLQKKKNELYDQYLQTRKTCLRFRRWYGDMLQNYDNQRRLKKTSTYELLSIVYQCRDCESYVDTPLSTIECIQRIEKHITNLNSLIIRLEKNTNTYKNLALKYEGLWREENAVNPYNPFDWDYDPAVDSDEY